jgi:phospholipid/cholesterol/gamma-HCH transport system substrate-binding protein
MRRGGPLVAHPGRAALISTLAVLAVAVYSFHPTLLQGSRFQLTGLFSASQGITKGAPVRVAGYDVGRVVGLSRGPGNTAEIRMELDDAAPVLYRGTTLQLRPRTFLEGGFYVELSPGAPAGAPQLKSGATVPLPQTAVAVQSDRPLSVFDSAARAHSATVTHELAVAFSHGGAGQIRALTREAPPILRDSAVVARASLGLRPGELEQLIQSAAAGADALAPVTRELASSVTDADRTFGAIARHSGDLEAVIALADDTLRRTPATLAAVSKLLPVVDRYTDVAKPALAKLPAALRSTGTLLGQGIALSRPDELPALLRTLTPALRRLPTLEARQQSLFGFVGPVSQCVAEKVTPALNAKVPDGALSSGRPAWLDLLHGFSNTAGAFQNFDGNGPYLRYESGLSEQTFSTGVVPGAGTLIGMAPAPLLGVRPVWNGPTPPPFHPEADCRTQAIPSLAAKAGAPPAMRTIDPATLRTPKVRRLLSRMAKQGGR